MTPDCVRVHINNALHLLQIITEGLESNLIETSVDNIAKAYATMTVSALYILNDYLLSIREGVEEHG